MRESQYEVTEFQQNDTPINHCKTKYLAFWSLAACSILTMTVYAAEVAVPKPVPATPAVVVGAKSDKDKPKDDKNKEPKEEKAKGPTHNVTLAEESGVLDLLTKAQAARVLAEKDPTIWPKCVGFYTDILRKYANTVYLDRWEGPEGKDSGFKNGLYRSTRQRVSQDIASLPEKGIATYQLINDPQARSLFNEAQEQFSERKMEQVAQEYFCTSYGDDALLWLAEVFYNRGAFNQSVARLAQLAAHPNPDVSKSAVLIRRLLAQAQSNNRVGAEKTLAALKALPAEAQQILRVGHENGLAAIEKLKDRVEKIANGATATNNVSTERSWQTYFGNAAHNQLPPKRGSVGVLKWSEPIIKLLYGPQQEVSKGPKIAVDPNTEQNVVIPETQNQHLSVLDGIVYLCDGQVVAAYPLGNPKPGAGNGGNAKFLWPGDIHPPQSGNDTSGNDGRRGMRNNGRGGINFSAVRHQPYFCTLGDNRLFVVQGPEIATQESEQGRGNQQEQKVRPNHIVALGAASGKLHWSLDANAAGFSNQSKADQEWLKTISFVNAPTYEAGVLYAAAVIPSNSLYEAWVVALDAESGRILWRSSICSAPLMDMPGPVKPAMTLPITVSGGNVFICTNLGAVGTLDAVTGVVKWIRVYERSPNTANRNNGWNNGQQILHSFWGPNPPIVYGNLLIVTPQDSEMMYAFYIESDPSPESKIVAGKRAWDKSRSDGESTGKDLKHILGISNGYLFVSGNNLSFFEAKSGKLVGPNNPLPLEGSVKGRGVVTENMIFLPTDKALVRLEIGQDAGRLAVTLKDRTPWADPAAEAGNVCIAGDVLFTVSHTHVNAYFVWEEMETRLLARIKTAPQEANGYIELADTYVRVDMHPKALAILEDGLKNAVPSDPSAKATEQNATDLTTLLSRKFDVLFTLGEKARSTDKKSADPAAAYDLFKQALEVALKPKLAPELPVIALVAMAETLVLKGDLAGAVAHYHEIVEKYGEVRYVQKRSTTKARLYAQSQIDELRKKDPACYAKIEVLAQAAFDKAGDKTAELEALLQIYPNSEVCGQALVKLAQLTLENTPAKARNFAQSFLRNYNTSPDAAQMSAILSVSQERLKNTGPAREILLRLTQRKEYADKVLAFDPLNPKVKPVAPLKALEWAAAHLKDPLYLNTPSAAKWSLSSGKLKQSWTRPVTIQSLPLQMSGTLPVPMRNCVFYVEKEELLVLSGAERGEEAWLPRPKLPAGATPRGFWAEDILLVFGEKEWVAYDSNSKGKVAWRKNYQAEFNAALNRGIQIIENRILISYPNGQIQVLNGSTGAELWHVQVDGINNAFDPVCGDGFVAVVGGIPTPNKIVFYNLETGALRGQADLVTGLALPLIAAGDRLYCVDTNKILRAFEGLTCKLQWEQPLKAQPVSMRAARGLLAVVEDTHTVKVFSLDPEIEKRELWQPQLPADAVIKDVLLDSDDLYVTTQSQGIVAQGVGAKARVLSFSVKAQGKLQWMVEISSEPFGSIGLNDNTLAAGHLVLTQSNWDPSGAKPSSVVLVDRRTGKLVWDTGLSTETRAQNAPDGTPQPSFNMQLFEGGLVFTEGKKRISYAVDKSLPVTAADTAALLAKLEQNSKDTELRIKVAIALVESGDHEKAIATLQAGMTELGLNDDKFSILYDDLSRLRREIGKKVKPTFSFVKVAKAPAMDGSLTDWTPIAEKTFESWKDVSLTNDEEGRVGGKKPLWKGATDLKVSFRGAYDDKNLFVMLIVTDDVHLNEQTEASQCDLGDSARLLFDIEQDGGIGWRGESFMLGAALNSKTNQTLGWRWVESGRFLRGDTPLKSPVSVTRKEAEKQTIYQFSLPLEYLKLKSKNGRKFGFTFVVNDQDAAGLDKSIGGSAGGARPPSPGLFGEGVLQEK